MKRSIDQKSRKDQTASPWSTSVAKLRFRLIRKSIRTLRFIKEQTSSEEIPREFEEHVFNASPTNPKIVEEILQKRTREKIRQSIILLRIWG